MNIYIGRSISWDSMSYPRVHAWPLPKEEEVAILEKYSRQLSAYLSQEDWQKVARSEPLDAYRFSTELVGLDDDEEYEEGSLIPSEVYVVLGAHPEKITWSGEWAPYRLRIDMAFNIDHDYLPDGHLSFLTEEEADCFLQTCQQKQPDSRFTVVGFSFIKSIKKLNTP